MNTMFAIYCTPVDANPAERKLRERSHFDTLARGFPAADRSEGEKLIWTALAFCGASGKDRQAHYYDYNRRLQIYATKKLALEAAKKMQAKNDQWKFTVQPVRITE